MDLCCFACCVPGNAPSRTRILAYLGVPSARCSWWVWVQRRLFTPPRICPSAGVRKKMVIFRNIEPNAHCGKVTSRQPACFLKAITSGISQSGACLRSTRCSGWSSSPASTGFSSPHSDPASKPARKIAMVRDVSSFEILSSLRFFCGTSRVPVTCPSCRRQMIGGPPPSVLVGRNPQIKKVEQGGAAHIAKNSPLWARLSRSE